MKHNCNLNIHYSLPDEKWQEIKKLYERMPNWIGFVDGIPFWYGRDENDKMINASVEPSGLLFYAMIPNDEWEEWISLFKTETSKVLGFVVGKPEDGFEFVY